MIIQAIIFNSQMWTAQSSKNWIKDHNFKPIKAVHKTSHFYRYRIKDPNLFSGFITKTFPEGIEIIFGIPFTF